MVTSSSRNLQTKTDSNVHNAFLEIIKYCKKNTQEEACTGLQGTEVPLRQSTPEATQPTLNQEVMPEIASVTSVSVTLINTETFPIITGLDPLQNLIPGIAQTTTDPSPLILGMPILHLGYISQPPPWLGLINQGIFQWQL